MWLISLHNTMARNLPIFSKENEDGNNAGFCAASLFEDIVGQKRQGKNEPYYPVTVCLAVRSAFFSVRRFTVLFYIATLFLADAGQRFHFLPLEHLPVIVYDNIQFALQLNINCTCKVFCGRQS
jgi:hypothetical protein